MRAARRTQSFTEHTIESLLRFADRLGFGHGSSSIEGFGGAAIIRHLAAAGAVFYIRLKADRFVELEGKRYEVKHLPKDDATVTLFGQTLRVVRSPKGRRCKEPWYVLTNDLTSSLMKIVQIYYYRFEIEETFRDMKHIWELKRTRLNRPNSVKTILWFVSLGIALLYVVTKPRRSAALATHPKKRTSWLRKAQETYQRDLGLLTRVFG